MSSNKVDEIVDLAYKAFFNKNTSKNFSKKPILIKEVLAENSLFKFDRESSESDQLLESLFNNELTYIDGSCADKLVFSRKNTNNNNMSLVTMFLYKNSGDVDSNNLKMVR